jgi:hypothetical protein
MLVVRMENFAHNAFAAGNQEKDKMLQEVIYRKSFTHIEYTNRLTCSGKLSKYCVRGGTSSRKRMRKQGLSRKSTVQ